jgi:hypothetical protein
MMRYIRLLAASRRRELSQGPLADGGGRGFILRDRLVFSAMPKPEATPAFQLNQAVQLSFRRPSFAGIDAQESQKDNSEDYQRHDELSTQNPYGCFPSVRTFEYAREKDSDRDACRCQDQHSEQHPVISA